MSEVLLNVAVGVSLIVAVFGIIVPVLPGTLLAAGALLVWAVLTGGPAAWFTFAIAGGLLALGQLLKFLLPHRSMTSAGVPGRSIVVGGIAAIAGFFLIPVVGLPVGFIGGVYVAEQVRLGDWVAARSSTWVAMRATGFAIMIELSALVLAASVWVGGLVALG